MPRRRTASAALCLLLCAAAAPLAAPSNAQAHADTHTSNWAVILSTSRYWFNYRHISDALTFYHICRRLGIPDSNIILMLPDDMACSPRNPFPGQVFNHENHADNLYGEAVEVDYRGYEVTVENFLRVLTGRHAAGVPRSKRLLSDAGSNVLVYMAGHGGDDFMKFQDQEEVMAQDIADAVAQMSEKARFRRLLLFVETCEAETLTSHVYSPGVITIATSKLGEKSYSHHTDMEVGLTVTDRVTFHGLQWFRGVDTTSNATLQQFLDYVGSKDLDSTLVCNAALFPVRPDAIRVMDFFGSVPRVAASDAIAAAAAGFGDGTEDAAMAAVESAEDAHGGTVGLERRPAAADVGAEGDIRAESFDKEAAAAEAPAAKRQQAGVAVGWALQADTRADVPLLLGVAAAAVAAAAASRWSRCYDL